jgi:hypothetical protein
MTGGRIAAQAVSPSLGHLPSVPHRLGREVGIVPYDPRRLSPGDVILVPGRGVLAWMIELSTANPFSHAAIATGAGTLVEAAVVVVERPASVYAQEGWAYRVRAAEAERSRAVTSARRRLGEPYGVRELLFDAARFDLHLVPKPRPLHHLTCSGLVAASYAEAGVILTHAPWPAPADLSYSPLLEGPRPWQTTVAARPLQPAPMTRRRARGTGLGRVEPMAWEEFQRMSAADRRR